MYVGVHVTILTDPRSLVPLLEVPDFPPNQWVGWMTGLLSHHMASLLDGS